MVINSMRNDSFSSTWTPTKVFFCLAYSTFLLATSVISMSTALHYKIHVESLKEKWHQIIYHELSRSEPVSPGLCQFPISRLRSPQIGVKSFDSTNNGCCVDVLSSFSPPLMTTLMIFDVVFVLPSWGSISCSLILVCGVVEEQLLGLRCWLEQSG